ncbi:unnamed protein product [Mucor fragilis]
MEDPLSIRRHTLPSTLFADPAIVRFIEKSSPSSSSSVFLSHLPQQQQQQQQQQQEQEEEGEDDDSIISSSIASSSFMQHQKPSPLSQLPLHRSIIFGPNRRNTTAWN